MWAEYVDNTHTCSSTGMFPFQCLLGYQPPLFPEQEPEVEVPAMQRFIAHCRRTWRRAQSALLKTSQRQQIQANITLSWAEGLAVHPGPSLACGIPQALPPLLSAPSRCSRGSTQWPSIFNCPGTCRLTPPSMSPGSGWWWSAPWYLLQDHHHSHTSLRVSPPIWSTAYWTPTGSIRACSLWLIGRGIGPRNSPGFQPGMSWIRP